MSKHTFSFEESQVYEEFNQETPRTLTVTKRFSNSGKNGHTLLLFLILTGYTIQIYIFNQVEKEPFQFLIYFLLKMDIKP